MQGRLGTKFAFGMKIIQHLVLSTIVISAGATGIAHAQGDARPRTAPSVRVDDEKPDEDRRASQRTSRDRCVTQEDLRARRLDHLKAADADGNAELSKAELEDIVLMQMAERRAQRMTKHLDVNGDGTVTLAEVEDRQPSPSPS